MLAVRVLGPIEVLRDGVPVDLGGPQQRAVVAHLALDAGRVVPVDRLIDRVWGDEPSRTSLGTLQSYVSRLRRVVEPRREAGAAPQVLVSEAPGYVLRLARDAVDAHRFDRLVGEARAAAAGGYASLALDRFDAALALWRGPALAGVGPDEQVRPIVVRLEEERVQAVEDRFAALLALGRHAEAVPALQVAVDEEPLRERRWALLALALYRSSRQADALRALATARTTLLDELGLDPGPELQRLESRILAQDPGLLATPDTAVPAPAESAPTPRPAVTLVGRLAELDALEAALERAQRHGVQVALVEGDAGSGKSTLAEAFLGTAAARGWDIAIGRCVESGLAPSLWPITEVVRAVVAAPALAGRTVPAAAEASVLYRFAKADEAVALTLSPVELADRFAELVDALGIESLVILLDDLHWADQATLDVLTLGAERLGGRRVLLVGTHRPPEVVPGSGLGPALGRVARAAAVHRVTMSPLGAAEVAELMEQTTGAAPSAEVAQRVWARAGGNPLFVAELARLAGERGISDVDAVPDAIRDVVRSRLAQLPPDTSRELEVVATLGERFDLRTAMAASERDPDGCLDALDAAIVTRIIVPDGTGYRFAHALVRDAVLAQLAPLRQARLHHRAAEAILATWGDGPDHAEPIAHHRLAARAVGAPLATAAAVVRGADWARWRGAIEASEALAEQALDVLAGAPRVPGIEMVEIGALEALAAAAYRRSGGDRLEIEETLAERFLAYGDRVGSDGPRALGLYMVWNELDEVPERRQAMDRRLREIAERTSDRYATVMVRFMLASNELMRGDLDDAQVDIDAAMTALGPDDPSQPPDFLPVPMMPVAAALICAARGDAAGARVHAYQRAAGWMSDRSEIDPTGRVMLGVTRALTEALLGQPAAVLAALAPLDLDEAHEFVAYELAASTVLQGWARVVQGDTEAVAQVLDGVARIDLHPGRRYRPAARAFAGEALIAAGDRRAVELLDAARNAAAATGERWWLAETIRLLALADRRFGDGSRAPGLLAEARDLARRQGAELLVARIDAM